MKRLDITFSSCMGCPYSFETQKKGLGTGYYACHKVYDDAPNYQGRWRSLGYGRAIKGFPDWCPLPTVEE